MWKKIFIAFGILFLLLTGAAAYGIHIFNTSWFKEKPQYVSLKNDRTAFDFHFSAGEYGATIEAHDLIKVPVRIKGVPQRFYLQWDTGSPYSLLYRRPLNSLKAQGFSWIESEGFLLNVEIEIGNGSLAADSFPIYENYGRTFEVTDSLRAIKLGTLGTDFMAGKICSIDFKNGKMEIYHELPQWMEDSLHFEPFSFAGRRMMLPAVLDGKKHDLFYDSGSSAFGLITTKGRFEDYSEEGSDLIRYETNSWGNSIPICHKETAMQMDMGGATLPLARVSYIDMYTPVQSLLAPFSKIGGWLGNKAFLEGKLILDCQKEEFIVIR